jgi:hypothetical protein
VPKSRLWVAFFVPFDTLLPTRLINPDGC